MAQRFENKIKKAENEAMYSDPTKEIGELTVYSDGREMVFSMTNPIVRPTLKPLKRTSNNITSKSKSKSKIINEIEIEIENHKRNRKNL